MHRSKLAVALILWPIVCGAAGNVLISLDAARHGSGWFQHWPIAVHLGVVAIAPAAALSTVAGFLLVRGRRPWLVFPIIPPATVVLTVGGVALHYFLLGMLGHGTPLPLLLLSSVAVAVLAVLLAVILLKGIPQNG